MISEIYTEHIFKSIYIYVILSMRAGECLTVAFKSASLVIAHSDASRVADRMQVVIHADHVR